MDPERPSVPVAPNECVIRGEINRVEPLAGGEGAVWNLTIKESTDIPGQRNLAKAHVASRVPVYVHPGIKAAVKPGDVVELRVSFQGDEHGAAFFLLGDDFRRLPENK